MGVFIVYVLIVFDVIVSYILKKFRFKKGKET